MKDKLLSIVIPCYNEEKNIPLLLERFKQFIQRPDIEVIFVNNGSKDRSAQIFEQLISQYSFARLVTVEVNQGYGFGILSGLKAANGEFIGWTHADLQTDPADVIKALDLIEKHQRQTNLYIKGLRKKRSPFDTFFTLGMSIIETLYLGKKLWDINAQPNIFHHSFFEQWQNPPHDFALDLYAYYQAKKHHLRVLRFSVEFPPRIHGTSSWNTSFAQKLKFIKRTLLFTYQLKKLLKGS